MTVKNSGYEGNFLARRLNEKSGHQFTLLLSRILLKVTLDTSTIASGQNISFLFTGKFCYGLIQSVDWDCLLV